MKFHQFSIYINIFALQPPLSAVIRLDRIAMEGEKKPFGDGCRARWVPVLADQNDLFMRWNLSSASFS